MVAIMGHHLPLCDRLPCASGPKCSGALADVGPALIQSPLVLNCPLRRLDPAGEGAVGAPAAARGGAALI